MAISNWDLLAVDQLGNPTAGVICTPSGISVELYKNWLYVHDPNAKGKAKPFSGSTIMEITEGALQYGDVHINAIRGPQDGIYAVVMTPNDYSPTACMVGCAVYGFDNDQWVGVTPESKAFLDKFIRRDEFPAMVRGLTLTKALRVNQGDAYFAAKIGTDPQLTMPGRAKEPMLSKG